MNLLNLGYSHELEQYQKDNNLDAFDTGRVIAEHKERYIISNGEEEFEGEIVGNLRFTATSRAGFPAVGDWVAISEFDEGKVLIHAIYPRSTVIERQSTGKHSDKQIIASNVDFAFVIQAVDRDFNINRIERYLTICYNSKVKPIIILNKIDLIDEAILSDIVSKIGERIKDVEVIAISNESKAGFENLKLLIEKGKTYCLLGSSGVGKSTLTNNLSGIEKMSTDEISKSTSKGRHVTSHRELIQIHNGGLLIDNPGMREVGTADSKEGLDATFDSIISLAENCRFADCSHTTEAGCAVIQAVEDGELDRASYDNYLRLEREQENYEMSVAEKRKKDKDFGKMVRKVKSDLGKVGGKYKDGYQ